MYDDFIDYGKLIDDAMHVIVKKALERVVKEGLPGKHHFFISFLTNHPGVTLSDTLRKKYPDEMTIVLQHQFEDLTIREKDFSVSLSFDGVKEKIVVPFDSLAAFADPSVKFGLQFRQADDLDNEFDDEFDDDELGDLHEFTSQDDKKPSKATSKAPAKGSADNKKTSKSKKTNVVSIDSFRKK